MRRRSRGPEERAKKAEGEERETRIPNFTVSLHAHPHFESTAPHDDHAASHKSHCAAPAVDPWNSCLGDFDFAFISVMASRLCQSHIPS